MTSKKRRKGLVGKPVLVDKLDSELGADLVEAVADDMERAREAREGSPPAKSRRKPTKAKRRAKR